MNFSYKIINPFTPKSSKPRKRKNTMVHRRKKRSKRHNYSMKHKKHNPVTITKSYNRRRSHRRKHYRKHHNPTFNALTATNILTKGSAAAIGGITAPFVSNAFQISGNMKYVAQIFVALGGYWLLKKFMPNAAESFAAGAIAVTAYQFFKDNAILEGLGIGSLGDDSFSPEDIRNLQLWQKSMVSGGTVPAQINGTIPAGIPIITSGSDTNELAVDSQEYF